MGQIDHTVESPFSLRRARLNQGKSIRQAAQAIGIAQATLARLEMGERVHPSSAKKVADFFKVQVTDLMASNDKAAAEPDAKAAA